MLSKVGYIGLLKTVQTHNILFLLFVIIQFKKDNVNIQLSTQILKMNPIIVHSNMGNLRKKLSIGAKVLK